MTIQSFQGRPFLLGPNPMIQGGNGPTLNGVTIDATKTALILVGRARTSDGGSHTINTTGSSKFGFRSGSTNLLANAGTTINVGLAAVDMSNGPPGRAVNSTGVITFDVACAITTANLTLTNNMWVSMTPTTGSKTIADGDLVAYCLQMGTRGGTDQINWDYLNANGQFHVPCMTYFNGSTYNARNGAVSGIWRFSDGAYGWIEGGDVFDIFSQRSFNSGSAQSEYGNLVQMPFPMRACGIYGAVGQAADCDLVLYSDPLGSPVAQRTVSIDQNTVWSTGGDWAFLPFSSPYDIPANTPVGVVFKPGGTSITAWYKSFNSSDHRCTEPTGLNGYGISRASGAFANTNSSLDQYYIGLMLNGFDGGAVAGPVAQAPLVVARGTPY